VELNTEGPRLSLNDGLSENPWLLVPDPAAVCLVN
jgi:hypothetical protein